MFDFKSLYPSLIAFNIDPLGSRRRAGRSDLMKRRGARFRREPAILPAARRSGPRGAKLGDAAIALATAIKILMNSFYGVLGTPACRFYNPKLANAITGQGKHFLLWSKDWFERAGYTVLYGDTDSLFVQTRTVDADAAEQEGKALAVRLNRDVQQYIVERWRVKSHLELEFEKLYVKLFLASVRHGSGGARKRYAGVIHGADPANVEFVGMEVVRRDWTELAKQVQRELYARLEKILPDQPHRRGQVRCDAANSDHARLSQGLPEGVGEYTASTPPHVAAAQIDE